MLNGDLRQKQASASVPGDKKTVPAHFDVFWLNRLRARENAQLNFQLRSFFLRNRREAIVVESRRVRGFRHRAVYGTGRQHVADASAQLTFLTIPAQVQRSKTTAQFGQVIRWRFQRDLSPIQSRNNGIVGQAKQQSAFLRRKFLWRYRLPGSRSLQGRSVCRS